MNIADKITRLQTAKTAIATAITDKGGTVNQGDGFDDFSADIATISSGGFDISPHITAESSNSAPLFGRNANFPDGTVLDLNLSNMSDVEYLFYQCPANIDKVSLTIPSGSTSLRGMAYNTKIKKIIFKNSIASVRNYIDFLRSNTTIEEVEGVIDLSSLSAGNNISYAFETSTIKEIRFAENSIHIAFGHSRYGGGLYNSKVLSDLSLISIANALAESVTGLALTLSSASKLRCNSISGTVSEVTSGDITYHKFTADESGTTTLTDFITNTKGWTLA